MTSHNVNKTSSNYTIRANEPLYLTAKIPVKTYHGYSGKWIQFRRGPIYKGHDGVDNKWETTNAGFHVVHKKKSKQYIYYWYLHAHNLYPFDVLRSDDGGKITKPWSKFKKYTLYFCEPDSEIYQNDSFQQSGIDMSSGCLVPLLFYAKHNGIKFKPITFIARTEDQIEQSLEHVKYCVVKEIGLDKLEIVSDDDIRIEYLHDNNS